MLGTSLFCITGSSSLFSPLLQKLSERLTTAIGGRDGLDNPGIWTSVGKHYDIDHIQKVMTQELKCNWHLWHSHAHILTAEDVNIDWLPPVSSPMSCSSESGFFQVSTRWSSPFIRSFQRKTGFCFVWNWLDHMEIKTTKIQSTERLLYYDFSEGLLYFDFSENTLE